MPLSRISFIMYLVHMNVENYILGLYPSNTSLNVTTGVSLYAVKLSTYLPTYIYTLYIFCKLCFLQVLFELGIFGYSAILSSILYICIELPWLNTEKFIFGMILRPRNQRKRIE